MAKPATLRVDIVADSKQATRELDNFSSKVAGFTAGITSAVAGFAIDKIAQAATSAAGSLVDGIEKAGNLSAAFGTLQYNFGEAATGIQTWAENAARAVGLSELAAVQAVNRFSVYAKTLGLSGQEAGDFSTALVDLASDLGAFADIPVSDAINAIGSAFRGERDPLERFGVLLNDTAVKAAYFRRTGEEVTGTLTSQQNILGTLQVLQEKGIEIGDAWGRETDQLGSKQQTLGAQFENVKTKIGTVLLPALSGAVGFISDEVIPAADDLIESFRDGGLGGAFDNLSERWSSAWPKISDALSGLWSNITEWISSHVPDWNEWVDSAWKWITDAAPKYYEKLLELGENVSKWLVDHIPDFAGWTKAASEWIDHVINGDPATGTPGIAKRLDGLLQAINTWIEDNQDEIGAQGLKIAAYFLLGIAAISILVARAFEDFKTAVFKAVWGLLPSMRELGASIAYSLTFGIAEWIQQNTEGILRPILLTVVSAALNAAFPGLGTIVTGLVGARSNVAAAQEAERNVIASAESPSVTNNYNIQVPPGVYGQDAGAAIAAAIAEAQQQGTIGNIFGG